MKCPDCGGDAIDLGTWLKGTNWKRTQCKGCGAALEANAATWAGLVLTVVLAVLSGIFLRDVVPVGGRKLGGLLAAAPALFVGAAVTWFVGGYRKEGG